MNRVRELVGGRSDVNHERGSGQSQTMGDAASGAGDDQTTVFESGNDLDDSETLNTVASGGETIGDLQRLGENSLKAYIKNKRKFDRLDAVGGLGVPLFHAVPLGVVKTIFSSKAPIMKIYKYVIIDSNKTKPPPDAEHISTDGSNVLYKYLFCSVYEVIRNNVGRVEHRFEFGAGSSSDHTPETVKMVNMIHWRNTDTKLNGLNLRWYGTSGFASPFGTANVKLLVLDDNMPSLMDQRTTEDFETCARNNRTRSLGKLPIWAKYSNEGSTVIPKKRTLKIAHLQIQECIPGLNPEGIFNMPLETQVLTCMCMVIHEFESRKDRRRTPGATLIPDMMFA